MARDIVFAQKVVRWNLCVCDCFRVPPFTPFIMASGPSGPFDGGREIADHRVEPDVKTFCFEGGIINRYRDPPIEVTCDGAPTQPLFQPILCELKGVLSPICAIDTLQPGS